MNTARSSPPPQDRVWGYDSIPHYRLNEDIINGYLRHKWGDFRFFTERVGDVYRFWVPRKLSEYEKTELLNLRMPQNY